MKYVFAVFLLFIMTFSVVVPLVEQIRDKDMCEMKAGAGDETDEERKTEKEAYTYKCHLHILQNQDWLNPFEKALYADSNLFISENHSSQLEMPPEWSIRS
jgi:hypothetical protein